MVRDAILLELPVGVVRCVLTEECSDLSPEYSSDTEEADSEASPAADPRWAPLQALVFEEEEDHRDT
jgi:uncharacterized metal-binding protein YceD (DUF177 family)|tara:strand:- start:578 stop:778 length:201 start_codon:yes stop_codon:yes gene_type:complete